MKKEINSKSRRKWIRGGLAAFASVALLTTGFAVWVVGTSKTGDDKDVQVKVDTAQNNSISFNLTLATKTIKLEESTTTAAANASGKPLVNVSTNKGEGAAFVATPMTLSASYTIKYGAAYDFKFKTIHFSIATAGNEGESNFDTNYATNKVLAENVKMGTTKKKSEDAEAITKNFARAASTTDYTYFEAPKDYTISETATGAEGGNKTITGTISLEFTWGTFFGSKASPATYYNDWANSKNINSVTDTNITDALTEEVTQEMNAMHSQLDGKKIRLKAELA